ncbi:MAG: hypothetical protein KDA58_15595, partial [Planctomycetaceae bacterium]|nr:hypothetical protein [Planctomycetaceae bacterium]
DEAIELVARRAAGSMRDSQSLFDQLLAFGGDEIDADDVHRLLGTAPDDRLLDLLDSVIDGRQGEAIAFLETALTEGVQLGSFSDQLLNYLRDLLVTAVGATTVPFTAVGERARERVQEQATRWGVQTISAAMQVLADTKARMQRVNYARALLELALVRMSLLENLDAVSALVHHVAQGGVVVSGERPAGRPSTTAGSAKPSAAARPASPPPSKKNADEPTELRTAAPHDVSMPVRESPEPSRLVAESATATLDVPEESSEEAIPAAPVAISAPEFTPENIDAFWSHLLAELPDAIAQKLKNASRVAISGPNQVEVVFPKRFEFSKTYCEQPVTRKKLETQLAELARREVGCRFVVDTTSTAPPPQPKEGAPRRPTSQRARTSLVDDDPYVQLAAAIFGGQVVEVRKVLLPPVQLEAVEPEETEGDDVE